MSTPDFHTGLDEPLPYACRLLRKAWRAGRQLVVTGAPAALSQLDQLLWTFEPGEFIPHLRLRAGQTASQHLLRTPIWLVDEPAQAASRDVLVNLGPRVADDAALFARVIELVGAAPDEVLSGRQRWRDHVERGLQPRNLPQGAGSGAAGT